MGIDLFIFIVRAHVVLELYVIRPKLTSLRVVLVLPHHLETLSKIITKICTETTQDVCFRVFFGIAPFRQATTFSSVQNIL